MKLSENQNLTTTEDSERIKVIPYASAIGSIKYAMLCNKPVVYLTMILARGTIVIQEWITGQRSMLSLVT